MNLTSAIMLVNKEVRPVRVSYDPDVPKHNDPNRLFKTLDPTLKKDDFVVVRTSTRHGFTVCKVTEIDFRVNFDSPQDYDWIVGRVDTAQFDEMVRQEKIVIDRIGDAEENRKRAELSKSLGLDQIGLTDLDIVHGARALPAAAPGAAGQTFGDAQPQPSAPPTPADPI
jgi:hypothetical protein